MLESSNSQPTIFWFIALISFIFSSTINPIPSSPLLSEVKTINTIWLCPNSLIPDWASHLPTNFNSSSEFQLKSDFSILGFITIFWDSYFTPLTHVTSRMVAIAYSQDSHYISFVLVGNFVLILKFYFYILLKIRNRTVFVWIVLSDLF